MCGTSSELTKSVRRRFVGPKCVMFGRQRQDEAVMAALIVGVDRQKCTFVIPVSRVDKGAVRSVVSMHILCAAERPKAVDLSSSDYRDAEPVTLFQDSKTKRGIEPPRPVCRLLIFALDAYKGKTAAGNLFAVTVPRFFHLAP
ncbi:unnamed protein product [Schistocephalus solidus]|uniref:Uncharacterized protein n=1 Tax=Schistocephalus solidus TaxID=70667 RepID=A0A3P7F4F8_SCHSO|nr:unnamed protein product [Schistocephalus solidus]